ncbi:hypothetical protein LXL04_006103 [Taraxacum kok-saghyz]
MKDKILSDAEKARLEALRLTAQHAETDSASQIFSETTFKVNNKNKQTNNNLSNCKPFIRMPNERLPHHSVSCLWQVYKLNKAEFCPRLKEGNVYVPSVSKKMRQLQNKEIRERIILHLYNKMQRWDNNIKLKHCFSITLHMKQDSEIIDDCGVRINGIQAVDGGFSCNIAGGGERLHHTRMKFVVRVMLMQVIAYVADNVASLLPL